MPTIETLSDREKEILILLANGASNKEIAVSLTISPNTVKVHLRNIYNKLEISSRSEATLIAVRGGLILVETSNPVTEDLLEIESSDHTSNNPATLFTKWTLSTTIIIGTAIIILAVIGFTIIFSQVPIRNSQLPINTPVINNSPSSITNFSWEAITPLPLPRYNMAAVTYNNSIYAIGGETTEGVTNLVEEYDPLTASWNKLTDKPTPVTATKAELLNGDIYIPGGMLEKGSPTNVLEIYSPNENIWTTKSELPTPLSDYSSAVLDSQLIVIGGWDGHKPVAAVLSYDPLSDTWTHLPDLPFPLSGSSAVTHNGSILVFGGENASGPQNNILRFTPKLSSDSEKSWEIISSLPDQFINGRAVMASSVVYLMASKNQDLAKSSFGYLPNTNEFRSIPYPSHESLEGAGLVLLDTHIVSLGGRSFSGISKEVFAYQVLFSIFAPIISP